ncbi:MULTISPECIES: alpha/beta hydrolase [unclassified Streptomyces]|uniref:alpha/beta fold hydrolase n=1 Tax=unclassified Streptomyces TaxID=2593676 RepID=UPI000DBAABFD|nr:MULTISPECIES: alpha/beta hydrolase [unclassified Streptomyces]MYT71434.1 alpha/beta fold hydrolase [Streptomyces sp. SID8367]RAJ82895.1 pimeloyl-ACP methyl ester carboxylesterase [Streptomyces sp. PsTaAH-137]
MPFVDVPTAGGITKAHYLVTGSGPGLVLVHGTGASAEANWSPLMAELSDRYTIVAPDLQGSGDTSDQGGPVAVTDMVAVVVAAARDAGLDRFHVVGHSLGAVVATAAAALHPDAVTSLTAHAGWVRTDAHMAFQFDLWRQLAGTDPDGLSRLILLTALGKDTLRGWDEETFAQAAAGFAEMITGALDGFVRQTATDTAVDLTALLPDITAPTLLLSSADDRLVPPHHQQELAERIPHARLLRVPGGHGLPGENPGLLTAKVAEFLDGLGQAPIPGASARTS